MAQLEIVTYTPYSITVKLTDLTANWPSPNTGVTEERKVTWKYKTSSGSYTTAGTSYLENYSSSTESDNYTFYNLNLKSHLLRKLHTGSSATFKIDVMNK